MKYLPHLAFITLLSLSACSSFKSSDSSSPDIYDYSSQITEQALYNDLAAFSHDSLQGRETGTEGLQLAADFLARKYTEIGLVPVGDNNSYFQHFDLSQPSVDSYSYQMFNAEQELIDESVISRNELNTRLITLYGGQTDLSGEISFAGYGIYNEETGVSHYPEDVEGKWLLMFYDRNISNIDYLQSLLGESGAVGALFIMPGDSDEFDQQAESARQSLGRQGRLSLAYLQEEDDDEAISPAFNRIHSELAATILGVEPNTGLADLEKSLSEEPEGFQAQSLDFTLTHEPDASRNTVTTKNIVAFLEGSDPELKDEVVVLSSHYDHVGIGQPDSTGDNIYNGADDDGSGTIATLHTAKAMAAAKAAGVGPRRSVLFLSVAAEEKGLLGSRYYSDHPIFPIESTISNINIDMIGRVDPEHVNDSSYVYIIGGEIISSGLDSLTQAANAMGDNITLSMRYNDLEDPQQFYRRSDHWNFGRLGVPFVFFFNGVHEDYHRPGDEIDKITITPYTQRTKLVYNLTAVLANTNERPVVDNQEFIEKTKVQPR